MLTPVAQFMLPAPAFCLRSTTSALFCLQPPRLWPPRQAAF